MKKHLLLFILYPLLLICSGCKKEMLDFDRLDGVQASGEWGIPVLNTTYTIGDILAQLENNNFISQDEDGQLSLNYSFDPIRVLTDSMLLSLPNVATQYRWQETFSGLGSFSKDTTFLFNLPANDIIIKRGVVMHGYLNLKLLGNVGTAILNFPNIKDASGNTFRLEFTGNSNERINLSGYVISFSYEKPNEMPIEVFFSHQETGEVTTFSVDLNVSTQNLRLKEITGKTRKFTENFSGVVEIGNLINKERYGGAFTLYDPKVSLHIKNTFNRIGGSVAIDTFHFTDKNNNAFNVLTAYPTTIHVLEGMNTEQNIENISSIHFSSDYEKIKFAGQATANPDGFSGGEISVMENSALDIKAKLEIPFSLKVDELYYQDTIDFNFGNSIDLDKALQSIVFRYIIGNALPFSVNAQAYLYNSEQHAVVDSLFYPELKLVGAFQGKMTETANILEIEQNRINKVLSADKIIIRFRLNTNGNKVSVNAKNGLKMILGVKVKYEDIDFLNLF